MWNWLRCLLGKHSDLLCFEHDKVLLRCDACGRETKGWSIYLKG